MYWQGWIGWALKCARAPLAFSAWSSSCCGVCQPKGRFGASPSHDKTYRSHSNENIDDRVLLNGVVELVAGNVVGDVPYQLIEVDNLEQLIKGEQLQVGDAGGADVRRWRSVGKRAQGLVLNHHELGRVGVGEAVRQREDAFGHAHGSSRDEHGSEADGERRRDTGTHGWLLIRLMRQINRLMN
jgi:hypothetical protein